MQPFLMEKPVAHSTASKFSAVLIGRIVSRYIYITLIWTTHNEYTLQNLVMIDAVVFIV